jgi:drug/metabolite transporter (DMT)-like permease
MSATARPASWKIMLAFGIIYFVWGSTFLAIRIGVHEVPPLLLAAIRFFVSGLLLLAWMRLRQAPWPTMRQWGAASILGLLIFVIDYGCLFWAEQRVPSGISAVILATIPVFVTVFEISLLRTQHLSFRLALALTIGLCGVAVLMNRSFSLGELPVDRRGAVALLAAALTWSFATIITRKLPLPESKPISAAAQMFSGGLQLFVLAGILGEWRGFRPQAVSWNAWFALIYLIIAGSIVGFTAYVWLLHYESPTRVGTYAYVNPVVAVALGYFLGGESVGARTLFGTMLVLVSVIAITATASRPKSAAQPTQVEAEVA